jgi:hypothetical protein
MEVSLVPVEYIESVWPSIEEYAKGAAMYTYGRFTSDDIKQGVLTKPQQLWVAFDNDEMYGMVVTEVSEYPQLKTLVMHFTGGKDLIKWKSSMLKLLQRFAKDHGCNVIESYGREGWGKVFAEDGFVKRFMFYELPVEGK